MNEVSKVFKANALKKVLNVISKNCLVQQLLKPAVFSGKILIVQVL